MRINKWLLMGTILGGCATAAPTTERSDETSASIRAAEEVGATHVPQASLHLQLAKEQSDHAKELAAKGESEQANLLMMRAEADAELAVALARSKTETSKAQEELGKVRTMQKGTP